MIRKSLVLCLLLGLSYIGVAQGGMPEKINSRQFKSYNAIGFMHGSTTNSLMINSVNGFEQKKWFAGIGLGVDFYFHTSVPLYLEGAYKIAGQNKSLHAVADVGLNFSTGAKNEKYEFRNGDYKTGHYYALGLNYHIPVKKNVLFIGGGFNQKQMILMADNNVWNPELNRIENIPEKMNYRFKRLYIKAGWVF